MVMGVVLIGRLKDTVIEEEQEWVAAGAGYEAENGPAERTQPKSAPATESGFSNDAFGNSRFPQQQNQRQQSEAFGNRGFHPSGLYDPHQQGHVTNQQLHIPAPQALQFHTQSIMQNFRCAKGFKNSSRSCTVKPSAVNPAVQQFVQSACPNI
ncbi:hypothetical protein quinque_013659 [Culex quinquefasciatus]